MNANKSHSFFYYLDLMCRDRQFLDKVINENTQLIDYRNNVNKEKLLILVNAYMDMFSYYNFDYMLFQDLLIKALKKYHSYDKQIKKMGFAELKVLYYPFLLSSSINMYGYYDGTYRYILDFRLSKIAKWVIYYTTNIFLIKNNKKDLFLNLSDIEKLIRRFINETYRVSSQIRTYMNDKIGFNNLVSEEFLRLNKSLFTKMCVYLRYDKYNELLNEYFITNISDKIGIPEEVVKSMQKLQEEKIENIKKIKKKKRIKTFRDLL